MAEQVNLIGKEVDKELEVLESKQIFDPTPFDGNRVAIERIEYTEYETHYIDGVWDDKKVTMQKGVLVITKPVSTITIKDGSVQEIRVKQRFNLQKEVDSKGEVKWVTRKNIKSKLWKLCRKCGVSHPSELSGKLVTLTLEPSKDPNDDRMFLRIAV